MSVATRAVSCRGESRGCQISALAPFHPPRPLEAAPRYDVDRTLTSLWATERNSSCVQLKRTAHATPVVALEAKRRSGYDEPACWRS